jgi:1,4-alpha-glucan branching enzyme
MDLKIHHATSIPSRRYFLHAWIPNGRTWDLKPSKVNDGLLEFVVPDVPYVRLLQFKFRTEDQAGSYWESDDFIRQIRRRDVNEVWTYDASVRIRFDPPGLAVGLPAQLVLHLITASRFRGGAIYAWNPYDPAKPEAYFPQTARDDAAQTSTFIFPLQPWMANGFHFKCVAAGRATGDWEPDRANKVWRPADGLELWLKSGQVSLRDSVLVPTNAPLELIHPATLSPAPKFIVTDGVEDSKQYLNALSTKPYDTDPLFVVSHYQATVYPEALYRLDYDPAALPERPPVQRVFPVDPSDPTAGGTLLLGAGDWRSDQPARLSVVEVVVAPDDVNSLGGAPIALVGVGRAVAAFETVTLVRQPDQSWLARFNAFPGQAHWFTLQPSHGAVETRPDGTINVSRTITPVAGGPTRWFTADSVFGLTSSGPVVFSDVSRSDRQTLLRAAFSPRIVAAGVFDPWEMPLGATVLPASVGSLLAGTYFVVNAPHAARVRVLLLDRAAAGGPTVRSHEMALTSDLRYWWCVVPAGGAPHGAEYRYALNDSTEILDPAARAVSDPGHLLVQDDELTTTTNFAAGPWSQVVDVARVRAAFAGSAWRGEGWEALAIYELHASRFTDANKSASSASSKLLKGFDQVSTELAAPAGYLANLPVTTLEFLPVHEFPSDNSWGYNPGFYFAIESSYGSPEAMAQCVRAANDVGKGVMLDLVYNHLADSSLSVIAPEVYTDGQTQWGPMINFDHPACMEYFRQATVYIWDALGIDGFRFDSTETIVNGGMNVSSTPYVIANGPDGKPLLGSGGGWEFLAYLRNALRNAADACNRPWPYLCGENEPNNWPMTQPGFGVQDGQWNFLLSRSLGDIAYKAWDPGIDVSGNVKSGLDTDQTWVRPYYESVRYGESHDSASGQDNGNNKRIAARPPYRQGLQMAKSVGAAAILCNGVPMLFMGQEGGETRPFSFDNAPGNPDGMLNPQQYTAGGGDPSRVLAWFSSILGLRNNPSNGFRGDDTQQVRTGRKTIAFTRGPGERFLVICTFGTPDTSQDSGWLGLPSGKAYKEIFNSSWPAFAVEFEQERTNGGYDCVISSGQILNLPYIGTVVLEQR